MTNWQGVQTKIELALGVQTCLKSARVSIATAGVASLISKILALQRNDDSST